MHVAVSLVRLAMGCIVAMAVLRTCPSHAATVGPFGADEFMLTGELRLDDATTVRTLPRGATLHVVAWGASVEAWMSAAAISDAAAERELAVDLKYVEDAAIGLAGAGGIAEYGRRIAHHPIPLSQSQMQAIASVMERFELACVGKVPSEAPTKKKLELVGMLWDRPETAGVRRNPDQRWYFDSAGVRQNWQWGRRHMNQLPGRVASCRNPALQRAKTAIATALKNGRTMKSAQQPDDDPVVVPDDPPTEAAPSPSAPTDAGGQPVRPSAPAERGWGFSRGLVMGSKSLSVPGRGRTAP